MNLRKNNRYNQKYPEHMKTIHSIRQRRILILALVVLAAISCRKEPEVPEEATEIVESWMQESEIPGLAICISRNGDIVWSQGFGYADLEHKVPVYPDRTRFRIGSISKPLTAAALGILMEQGRIDPDAPVQDYVTYFPGKKYPVTTRQVAGHLAGIRHYINDEWLSARRYHSVEEGLGIFMDDPLLFEPGTDYFYSSYGFNLLSAVIEGASGQDFLGFIHENVFTPLEMHTTVEDRTDSIIPDRAAPYSMNYGIVTKAPYVDNSYKWAGGGFLSSAGDLVRFGNVMLSDTFLAAATVKELVTTQKTAEGEETGYGMGFFTGVDDLGYRYFGHGGGSVGGISDLVIFPDQKIVMAIVCNDTRASFQGSHRVAELFMEAEPE